jgi:hypothetical protein
VNRSAFPNLTDRQVAEVFAAMALEAYHAPRCFWCRHRCDPPFGNGERAGLRRELDDAAAALAPPGRGPVVSDPDVPPAPMS